MRDLGFRVVLGGFARQAWLHGFTSAGFWGFGVLSVGCLGFWGFRVSLGVSRFGVSGFGLSHQDFSTHNWGFGALRLTAECFPYSFAG